MEMLAQYWWLMPVSFLASVIASATGAAGGTLMLAVMALTVPGPALVPLHGFTMGLQNFFRALLLWNKTDWTFVTVALAGSVIGAVLAGPLMMELPDTEVRVALAVVIIYILWAPKMKEALVIPGVTPPLLTATLGVVLSALSMFGGGAILLLSTIRYRLGRRKEGLIADQSVIMAVQNMIRAVVFGLAGFAFGPYLLLLGAMAVAGMVGTYVGVEILKGMAPRVFDRWFKIAVTIGAIGILVRALL